MNMTTGWNDPSDYKIKDYFDLSENQTLNQTQFTDVVGERYYPLWFEIPLWLLMIGLSIETILGNALVVLAYNLDRGIQKHFSNQYIVSLAISDMIIGLEGFPLLTIYVVHGEKWTMGPVICQIWLFLDYAMCLVSILTVLLITVDRYGSVCYPARYLKWQSPEKVKILIAVSWLIPCLLFGLMIFGWAAFTGETVEADKCYAPFLNDPYVNMTMYIIYYWTTLVAMLILYRGIHKTAKNLERKAQARDKQHLALMMGQTCFAKVGVGLIMHDEKTVVDGGGDAGSHSDGATVYLDAINVDSGYTTAQTTGRVTSGEGLTVAEVTDIPVDDLSPVVDPVDSNKSTPTSVASSGPTIHRALSARHRRMLHMNAQDSVTSMEVYDDNTSLLSKGFGDASLTSLLTLTFDRQRDMAELNSSGAVLARVHRRRSSKSKCSRKNSKNSRRSSSGSGSPIHMNGSIKSISNPISIKDNVVVVDTPMVDLATSSVPSYEAIAHGTPTHIILRPEVRIEPVQTVDCGEGSNSRGSKFRNWRMATFKKRRRSSVRRPSADSDDVSLSDDESDDSAATPPSPKLTTIVEDQSYHNHPNAPITSVHHLKPPSGPISRPVIGQKDTRQGSTGSPQPVKHKRRNALSVFLETTGTLMKRRRKKNKAERKARKAFRTITIIVGFFALFWSPYYITATIYGFCPECVPSAIFLISYYMCYLNSSGNPFAYALANRQFRVAFLRMLRGDFSPHNQ